MTKEAILEEVRGRITDNYESTGRESWYTASVAYCGNKYEATGDTSREARSKVLEKVRVWIDQQVAEAKAQREAKSAEQTKENDLKNLEELLNA